MLLALLAYLEYRLSQLDDTDRESLDSTSLGITFLLFRFEFRERVFLIINGIKKLLGQVEQEDHQSVSLENPGISCSL